MQQRMLTNLNVLVFIHVCMYVCTNTCFPSHVCLTLCMCPCQHLYAIATYVHVCVMCVCESVGHATRPTTGSNSICKTRRVGRTNRFIPVLRMPSKSHCLFHKILLAPKISMITVQTSNIMYLLGKRSDTSYRLQE